MPEHNIKSGIKVVVKLAEKNNFQFTEALQLHKLSPISLTKTIFCIEEMEKYILDILSKICKTNL